MPRYYNPFTGASLWLPSGLTERAKYLTLASAMFSSEERRRIEDKALEQALLEAKVFGVELEPLLPVVDTRWPFVLSEADRLFLKIQRIDPA